MPAAGKEKWRFGKIEGIFGLQEHGAERADPQAREDGRVGRLQKKLWPSLTPASNDFLRRVTILPQA